jgi:DNA-binding NtrC family response regulator
MSSVEAVLYPAVDALGSGSGVAVKARGDRQALSTRDPAPSASPAERMLGVLCLLGSGAEPPPSPRLTVVDRHFVIGRDDPALSPEGWAVPDETVSRRHAVIEAEGGGWVLHDLGSRNGTLVDHALVKGGRAALADGALLGIGAHLALFRSMSEEQLRAVTADQERPLGPLPTASPALASTVRRLRALAPTDSSLLLSGETGTGKEVYARAVHALSGRSGPFVPVNCASLQRDLLESELFGYKRGSHSQATADHPGIVSMAEGGTLFLDEIGEMPQDLQARLLRFLQDRTYYGLGWLHARRADVRVIAATQEPRQSLRADVLGRFGAEPFLLPPLRSRAEDVGPLSHHFLAAVALSGAPRRFERQAFLALCRRPWPRNVRELQAVVTESVVVAAGRGASQVALRDLPGQLGGRLPEDGSSPEALVDPAEQARTPSRRKPRPPPTREQFVRLLKDSGGDVPTVARTLDRHREQIWRWCKSFGIDPQDFRVP